MRAVFLALLSANVLFLAWARWVDAPAGASAADTLARLPRLQLVSESPPQQKPTSGIAQRVSFHEPAAFPTPSACTSVGPFNDMADAARAAAVLLERGFNPHQRAEQGEALKGYWVYVSGMKTDDDVSHVVTQLEKSGFTDAHVMKESAQGRRVSVGLFSQRDRAERRSAAVKHMGLDPEIAERNFPGTVYWVDFGLRPGTRDLPADWLVADAAHTKVGMKTCPGGTGTANDTGSGADAGPGTEIGAGTAMRAGGGPAVPGVPDDSILERGKEDAITRALPRTTVASAPKRR